MRAHAITCVSSSQHAGAAGEQANGKAFSTRDCLSTALMRLMRRFVPVRMRVWTSGCDKETPRCEQHDPCCCLLVVLTTKLLAAAEEAAQHTPRQQGGGRTRERSRCVLGERQRGEHLPYTEVAVEGSCHIRKVQPAPLCVSPHSRARASPRRAHPRSPRAARTVSPIALVHAHDTRLRRIADIPLRARRDHLEAGGASRGSRSEERRAGRRG